MHSYIVPVKISVLGVHIHTFPYSVCHIAGEFIERLQQQISTSYDEQLKSNAKISRRDVLCVKIAALCHDLGQQI